MTKLERIEAVRNPFNVMDVPNPDDAEVIAFAASTTLDGNSDDPAAEAWTIMTQGHLPVGIEGPWASRWNGGADPTIQGDAPETWKMGHGKVKEIGDRVYLLFNWDNGKRKGLIDAKRDGKRLMGKYINLTSPEVMRPWIGLIVSNRRIDGRWTNGRLDFRR